jgi:predicted lipid-binding transport protein (Tim44 family)
MSSPGGGPTPGTAPSPQPADPESALPSVAARVLAFASILVGGLAGGFIGYAFADIGGFGGASVGILTFLGAVMGAGGVAVVAVLTLRALGEWETIRRRDPDAARAGRVPKRPS